MKNLVYGLKKKKIYHIYTGYEYREKILTKKKYISTGSKSLDELLDYGIESFRIYGFYGPAGSGKTILLHQIIANSFIDDKLNYAYYLDAEGNFNPRYLASILNERGKPNAMKYIKYSRIRSKTHFISLLNKISSQNEDTRIIVIDDFTNIVRKDNKNRDPYELHFITRSLLMGLHNLKERFGIPILLTLRVYGVIDNLFSEAYEPYGGIALKTMVNKLIHLSKEGDIIRAVDQHSKKPTALFRITNKGVMDI